MADARLESRCGIYCGACYIYRAERDGGALLDELSKELGVPRDRIRCNGCSSPHEEQWVNCQDCHFKQCQRRRGIENCAQCGDFETCPDYKGAVKFTEYRGENMREGVRRIAAGEGEAWLLEQEQRWSCPECGHSLMWYDNNCRGCGKKVKDKPVSWKPTPPKS
jgi:predicted RNA-binding Zn-ribbon protein involved in translation (DUF1610 family)